MKTKTARLGGGNRLLAVFAALAWAVLAAAPGFAAYNAAGGYVTLLSGNLGSQGESTFMTNIVRESYGWSDGMDPHSGTNYYCKYQLCSPKVTDGTFKFPGDSLTIGNGSVSRLIVLAASTLDIDDFRLEERGYVMTMDYNAFNVTLQGSITILGDESNPSWFLLGTSPQWYKIEAAFKGGSSAFAYSELAAGKSFTSFATQYVELDDADEYYGTFEVRTNTCLKLASDMSGTVSVKNGACLIPVGVVKIATLSLEAGATIDFSGGGTIAVTNGFSASGKIAATVSCTTSYPQPVLTVPAGKGTLAAGSFAGDGVRFTVSTENGIQTLYAEVLEPTAFDATTGYVTQIKGGAASSSPKDIFDDPEAWSDTRVPHSDTNYYGYSKGIYITTNSTFAGRSLTIERTSFRLVADQPVTIGDLRVKGGSGPASSVFTTSGKTGRYYLNGGMTVLSKVSEVWPFAFYGGLDEQAWISNQKITGDETRAFGLRGKTDIEPGNALTYAELLGDLSEYFGTIIVGTNFTARLGGSSMPGTIRLDTAYSHVDTMAADGAEVKVGNLTSRIGTSITVAATNTLTITDSLSVTGTLTKNGGGIIAAGGIAAAGADAALNVAAGGLRADSARAFDGIPISFADGAVYVRDFAAEDAGLVQYGLYNESVVTAAGTLYVRLVNTPAEDATSKCSVALFTVPESGAGALASAIRFSPRKISGLVAEAKTVPIGGGMATVTAVLERKGFMILVY